MPPGVGEVLLVYGPLGIAFLAFGWFGWRSYKREAERADRLEGEVKSLNQQNVDKVIPALTAAATAVQVVHERERERDYERRHGGQA